VQEFITPINEFTGKIGHVKILCNQSHSACLGALPTR
jgi:hypothetical protein